MPVPTKRKPANKKNVSNNRNNTKKKPFNKNDNHQSKQPVEITEITFSDGITVGELADKLHRQSSELIKALFMEGKMVTINSALEDEMVELVCMNYNIEAVKVKEREADSLEDEVQDSAEDLQERPPVVTIMGHVDHGKTTLLDTIRRSKVAAGEAGGITQAIGAYQVTVNGRKVTFLDTPGHEAFTAMRARGASVTDLAVIVVAADDGVMPQTREAIDHAKAAGVPIIVAVNKMDKPDANPDHVKSEMAELGVMPEEWGGDTIFVNTSAKKGDGIDELLETILIVSDVKELKANPNRTATGTVVEAKLDKGRGPVATLLVQNGTLKHGDPVVVGTCFGKVRRMTDENGNELKTAGPSRPEEIIGLNDVPIAGDIFKAFDSEKKARQIAETRLTKRIDQERNSSSAMSLDDLARQIEEGEVQDINVIVKADVQGSAEAVKASMEKIEVSGVKVNVIRSTAGAITESDIMLASASNAVIYGFNVRPNAMVRKKAEEEGVDIRLHNIIYEEVVIGQAEVRQTYKVSKVGTIAGCMVTDGHITKDCSVRLIREGVVIYTGKLGSLRRFQNDVKEVQNGFECGMTIENFNDIKEGDLIEAYEDQQVEPE